MNSLTVRRAIINLGNMELDVFQMPDGSYRLSELGCEQAVGKPRKSTTNFLRSQSPYALPYKGFHADKLAVEGEPMRINGIPFELAVAYWTKEAVAGNIEAAILLGACAAEALERRADKAFAVERSEEERNVDFADFLERWRGARNYAKNAHTAFAASYELKNHPGHAVHDLMTTLIFGQTAAEARLKDLVDPEEDVTIGLNHQEDMEKMMILADAKFKYARLKNRSEPWTEQTARAVKAVMKVC